MVMLRSTKPVITYEVYDDHGKSVGCVVLPKSDRIVGKNRGTVLLQRSTPPASPRTSPRLDAANRTSA